MSFLQYLVHIPSYQFISSIYSILFKFSVQQPHQFEKSVALDDVIIKDFTSDFEQLAAQDMAFIDEMMASEGKISAVQCKNLASNIVLHGFT